MNNTLILIKPEAIENKLVGIIISYFERAGFRIEETVYEYPHRSKMEKHYQEHKNKDFFKKLIDRFDGKPIIAINLRLMGSKGSAVKLARNIIGATIPSEAKLGTIRGDFRHIDIENCSDYGANLNLVHASDSEEAADRELSLWFLE